jgi:hypothetical protein
VRTWLIERGAPAPAELRSIVERGSTEVIPGDEPRPDDLDRVVIWLPAGVPAEALPSGPGDGTETLLVVPDGRAPRGATETSSIFCWPSDKDRLMVLFLTGG